MSLVRSQRFLPLFITQFCGAFNDNMLKNALVMLITYRISAQIGENTQLLVTIAGAIFILPFFLFSATAGQLADKYDRAKLVRIIKITEIIIMAVATIGFLLQSLSVLLISLFAMGTHSTFFSPIRYALLPQHLREHELLTGNAYMEAGTFLAILLGTISGGLIVLRLHGDWLVSGALFAVALIGYISSRSIPAASPPDPGLVISRNIWKETWHIVGFSKQNRAVFICVLGISWFWLIGATYLTQFPVFVKDVLGATPEVVTLFLTIFSIGIGFGSFLCDRLLHGTIHSTYVPWAALGMALFGVDFYFASIYSGFSVGETLIPIEQFLASLAGWRITLDLLGVSICAGLYIVPLYTIMQHRSEIHYRARIIAANNIMNAIFMVGAAFVVLFLLSLSFTIPTIFVVLALANGVVAFYIRALKE
ncbi:MAG: MFS transporter [Rickettsiales bacterium]|nr:MFS transporter [Rickettsiales bacterium]